MAYFTVGHYYTVKDKRLDVYDLGVGNKYLAVGPDVLQLPPGMGWSSSSFGSPEGKYSYLYLDPSYYIKTNSIIVGGE